jgi:hypothetical protein
MALISLQVDYQKSIICCRKNYHLYSPIPDFGFALP